MAVSVNKLYIDGKWVKSDSGKTFDRINPANLNDKIGTFQKGNEKDVSKAVDAAADAFEKWRDTPAPKRGKIIAKFGQLLTEQKEDLGRLVTREMGKVIAEGRADVQEAIDTAEYISSEGRRLFGRTTTSELPNRFNMTTRNPLGVVAAITPWNFPIAIPTWKITVALVCGNTVVLKPSSDTPLCATKFVELFEKAGLPEGVLNLVTGSGSDVGTPLVKNKKVRAVSFTGHKDTGSVIMKDAGVGKKVGMEMGSKNVTIIMDDADLKAALDGVIFGAFGTCGQRCTASSRVILHSKIKQKFENMLTEKTKKLKIGDGLKPSTDVGPLVNETAQKKVSRYIEIGKHEAKLKFGGDIPEEDGWFMQPTIFTDATKDMRISQEEIFGPVVSLIEAKNFNEAIDIANSVEYGLSSSIYTNNIQNAMKSIKNLEFGITYVNSSTIGAEVHLPFGGAKASGNGWKEVGWKGIDFFTEEKSVFIDYSGKLQKAQMD